jgi:hypothetical protein
MDNDAMPEIASGAEHTTFHRSTHGTRVFNYVQWESAAHLAAMQRSSRFQAIARGFAGLVECEPHECEVVRVGEHG